MDHIKTLLPKVLHKRGLMGQATAAMITHQARQWLGREMPSIQGMLQVKSFNDGVLTIATSHSIAAQECQGRSEDLLLYLQKECGHKDVRAVRFMREESVQKPLPPLPPVP